MKLLVGTISLIASNFIFQYFNGQYYGIALDRSVFQVVAILYVWASGVVVTK